MKNEEFLWVLTGINKLTGEREAFSAPQTRESADKLLEKALETNDYDRAFLAPAVEKYENYAVNEEKGASDGEEE